MTSSRRERGPTQDDRPHETELKFGVDAQCAASVESSLRRLGARAHSIESHYFDSQTGHLAQAKLSLRLRHTAEGWEQTLKGPGRSAVDRLEVTLSRPAPEGERLAIDLGLHADTRAGALLCEALGVKDLRDADVQPVFVTRIRRLSAMVEAADASVEVAFDTGTIECNGQTLPVCELEYELKSGPAEALYELGRAGVIEHGLWLNLLSKSMRGSLLASGRVSFAPMKAQRPRITREMGGPLVCRKVVEACFEQIAFNASALLDGAPDDGAPDDETVHQLRIGLRRLRTAHRDLMKALDAAAPAPWLAAMTETFRALGDYRDATVVVPQLQRALAAAGSPQPTLRPPDGQLPDPLAPVRGTAFQTALLQWLASSREDSTGVTQGHAAKTKTKRVRRKIALRLQKLHRRLSQDARRFEALERASQHGVRKRLKRLRYLSELVRPLYRRKEVEACLDLLRPAQDALGRLVDSFIGEDLARQAAERGDGANQFNVGALREPSPAAARHCAKALKRAMKARVFW